MDDLTVTCACSRVMTPVGSLGPGHYRCANCRTRIKVSSPLLRREEGRCTWITSHKRCPKSRYEHTPLCEHHCRVVAEVMLRRDDIRQAVATKIGGEQFAEEVDEARKRRAAEDLVRREKAARVAFLARPPTPMVYYVRLGPAHIKIGTTTWLPQRLAGLRVIRESDVLAAEPGGHALEKRRHKQFAHLRYHKQREDFQDGSDLMGHIDAVRAEHGDPFELLQRLVAEARNHQ